MLLALVFLRLIESRKETQIEVLYNYFEFILAIKLFVVV